MSSTYVLKYMGSGWRSTPGRAWESWRAERAWGTLQYRVGLYNKKMTPNMFIYYKIYNTTNRIGGPIWWNVKHDSLARPGFELKSRSKHFVHKQHSWLFLYKKLIVKIKSYYHITTKRGLAKFGVSNVQSCRRI